MLIDPSWEVKADYDRLPEVMAQVHRKWNVGVLALWYPLLREATHAPMLDRLAAAFPGGLRHEVVFPPARDGHRMAGSGMFVVNPPWGLADEAARIAGWIAPRS
jgi:23S rRNA (adenine2030-N6)-methyltransferase